MTIRHFIDHKQNGEKLTLTTCYDYWSAKLLSSCPVDALLIGDSAAMVMHGHPTTLPASLDMMAWHTAAVTRGAPEQFLISDVPFLGARRGLAHAMEHVETLMRAGAHAVKIEGERGHGDIIAHIVESGIPVMGHLGVTPQSVHGLGGYRPRGVSTSEIATLVEEARGLENAGCFAVVLECVPAETARQITGALDIPTIGIGAGPHVDGQVLVLHDLLGFNPGFHPKFVRAFADGARLFQEAVTAFDRAVKEGTFPDASETYS
jgi:3-methyl-2-oxobutanoate hydroxymethyltransferase